MNNDDVSQKALNAIKAKKIKPRPRWEFLLKDYVIWAIFGLAVLIGSLSVSVIIFMVGNSGWDNIARFGFFKLILANIPYFWILILIVFLFLAYYNFKHTKGGYKYNPYLIIIISILISAALGSVVYGLGGGEKIEKIFYRKLPLYQKIMNRGAMVWLNPQDGKLAGVIISKRQIGFVLKDFNGKIWGIILAGESAEKRDLIKAGIRIKVLGEQMSENEFKANYIRPWFGKSFLKENRQTGVLIDR